MAKKLVDGLQSLAKKLEDGLQSLRVPGKRTRGRQKIEMKRIENGDDRLITFSKRRSGIYKMACELVTLCGAEISVVVFSPAGKPFVFAHPSMESVSNRFSKRNPPQKGDGSHPLVEAHRRVRINELNQQYCELVWRLEAEKDQGKALQRLAKARGSQPGWWEAPVEELSVEELSQMVKSLEELHKILYNKIM
ncbi:agamous-like MADS-box protein AGL61 [Corylus avellana]|uniref:agamous-like MADS-box protein AGL61 n=1 Tax=Corylus avellana TaxID=13451 RepID=UPI00286D4F5F|nr:agamous-like MADS-box protein AGL61 [Corylus avellana]XP_059436447.1 agamous-like MADS-box protein AGL61 [Corylus avellana]